MASIQCRKGETWPNTHTHVSVAEVRACQTGGEIAKPTDVEPDWNFGREPNAGSAPHFSGNRRSDFPDMGALESQVPAGRYAIEADDTLKFYRVDKPTEGRWVGYTFIKVQASDDLYPVKAANARYDVLSKILAAGVAESSARYGMELGECGVCGRSLTNENSRAVGRGPICSEKMGW